MNRPEESEPNDKDHDEGDGKVESRLKAKFRLQWATREEKKGFACLIKKNG